MNDYLITAISAFPVGLFVGAIVGILGAGGGVVALPVLTQFYGHAPHTATMESLLIVWVTALIALPAKIRSGWINYRAAGAFAACSMAGAALGRSLSTHVPAPLLMWGFAAFIILTVIGLILDGRRGRKTGAATEHSPAEQNTPSPHIRYGYLLPAATLVGTATGLFGVGGGFIIVPTLCICAAMSMRRAGATSTLILWLTASAGLLTPVITGMIGGAAAAGGAFAGVSWPVMIGFLTGSSVAAALASPLAASVPERYLRRGFIALLLIVGLVAVV
ncbi:MAG: sulfite exporter TauE/SafE family protein [Corynebacterium sp.]|nr:sulfite exporter TauE/SafE family protein [Corynebacterium sp.]